MKKESYTSSPPLGPCGLLQGETLPYHTLLLFLVVVVVAAVAVAVAAAVI
jgi:hypothetical protein